MRVFVIACSSRQDICCHCDFDWFLDAYVETDSNDILDHAYFHFKDLMTSSVVATKNKCSAIQ